MPASHFASAQVNGDPESVFIDVYADSAPGTIVATIPNGDIQQVGSELLYLCDLYQSSVAGALELPSDASPVEKGYTLIWQSDVPGLKVARREFVSGIQGRLALDRMFRRERPVYPSAPIPERGLTQSVIDKGGASYMRVDFHPVLGTTSDPAFTYYEVLYYDSNGRVEEKRSSTVVPSP